MTRTRYQILPNDQNPYFVTSTTLNWFPLFSNPNIANIIIHSLKFLMKNNRIVIYAYVLMENHIHLVAMAEDLSKELANFKSFTARRMIDFFQEQQQQFILEQLAVYKDNPGNGRKYKVWQEGFGPKRISDRKMMEQKIEYIHHNPVRCGYVDEPEHWRYSSARNYAGIPGLI
jgi:putative transposase